MKLSRDAEPVCLSAMKIWYHMWRFFQGILQFNWTSQDREYNTLFETEMFQTFSNNIMCWVNKWHKHRGKGWGGRAVYKFTQSKVQQHCFIWARAAPASFRQTHMGTRRNITTTHTHTGQAATGLLCNSVICRLIMNTQNVHIKKRPVKTTTFKLMVSDKKLCETNA